MADWHKINQADWINVSYRITDSELRLQFLGLALHCLNEGGFPDNDEDISFIVGLPVASIQKLRPYLDRLSNKEDGKLTFKIVADAMAERAEFGRKQAERRRGTPKPTEDDGGLPEETEDDPGDEYDHHGQPRSTTVNHGQPIQSINQSGKKTGKQEPPARGMPPPLTPQAEVLQAICVVTAIDIGTANDFTRRDLESVSGKLARDGETAESVGGFASWYARENFNGQQGRKPSLRVFQDRWGEYREARRETKARAAPVVIPPGLTKQEQKEFLLAQAQGR
jgi:hypothetical protein